MVDDVRGENVFTPNINPNSYKAYLLRGNAKESINDLDGSCADWLKASVLGSRTASVNELNKCMSNYFSD